MKKFGFILVVTLMLTMLLWLVPGSGGEETPAAASPSVPLGLPGAAAELATDNSTFPSDEAGLAAYLRVSPLDMVKAGTAFEVLHRQGGNWVVGIVPVTVYPAWDVHSQKTQDVFVYIDSQGWVVAYLNREYPPAGIMVWAVDRSNPTLTAINTTSLEDALQPVIAAAGFDFSSLKGQVGYYHFGYPEANGMTLAVKVKKVDPNTDGLIGQMSLSVAQGSTIYSESLSIIASRSAIYCGSLSGSVWRFNTLGASHPQVM